MQILIGNIEPRSRLRKQDGLFISGWDLGYNRGIRNAVISLHRAGVRITLTRSWKANGKRICAIWAHLDGGAS